MSIPLTMRVPIFNQQQSSNGSVSTNQQKKSATSVVAVAVLSSASSSLSSSSSSSSSLSQERAKSPPVAIPMTPQQSMAKRLERLSLNSAPDSDSEDEEDVVIRAPSTTPSTSLPKFGEAGQGQLVVAESTSDDDLWFGNSGSDDLDSENRTTPTPPPSLAKVNEVDEQLKKLVTDIGFSSLSQKDPNENK